MALSLGFLAIVRLGLGSPTKGRLVPLMITRAQVGVPYSVPAAGASKSSKFPAMNCVSSNRSSNPIIWTGILITCDQSADAGHSKNLQDLRPLVQARKFPLPFNEDDARLMPQKPSNHRCTAVAMESPSPFSFPP